jgi:hypothetical protein
MDKAKLQMKNPMIGRQSDPACSGTSSSSSRRAITIFYKKLETKEMEGE